MSSFPTSGVVDCNCETWECDNLTVVDASVFPTATAANPMMTILAVSHMVISRLALRLRHEDGKTADIESRAESLMRKREEIRQESSFWAGQIQDNVEFQSIGALFWFWYKSKPLLRNK